ncbi:MAG TPA: enoyl-CoA hydratase-related protein [Blastocatellia bacterium]|nr:enoyl-CoA hydratase-related protein [Blastocatellia bacterium]
MYQTISYQIRDQVAYLTLNRPEKRNALNDRLVGELKTALAEAEAAAEARLVVLRGAGQDFCAGADLSQLRKIAQGSILDNFDDAAGFAALLLQIRKLRRPVVAAVHGRAFAGGAGLALACDLTLAARSASFCFTEVKIGFVPAIVMAVARRNLSEKRAFELLCTGRTFGAEEAERLGFINGVFNDENFEIEVEKFASRLSPISGSAIALTKSLLYQTEAMTFEQALQAGVQTNTIARLTPDCRAGVEKFLSKS